MALIKSKITDTRVIVQLIYFQGNRFIDINLKKQEINYYQAFTFLLV